MKAQRRGMVAAGVLSLAVTSLCGCASFHSGARFERMMTSEIYSIRYDPAEQILTVVTRTGDVIEYGQVDVAAVEELRRSEDPDAYYREHIKGRQPFRTLDFSVPEPPAAAPSPATEPPPSP